MNCGKMYSVFSRLTCIHPSEAAATDLLVLPCEQWSSVCDRSADRSASWKISISVCHRALSLSRSLARPGFTRGARLPVFYRSAAVHDSVSLAAVSITRPRSWQDNSDLQKLRHLDAMKASASKKRRCIEPNATPELRTNSPLRRRASVLISPTSLSPWRLRLPPVSLSLPGLH